MSSTTVDSVSPVTAPGDTVAVVRVWKSPAVREGIVLAARLLLGAVMLWAGIQKLRLPWAFLDAVYAYELTGPMTGAVVAATLPWLEVILGLLLLIGFRTEEGLLAAALIMGFFVLAQISVVLRGLDAPCACFGAAASGDETTTGVGWASIIRTSLLALVAFVGWWIAVRMVIGNANKAAAPGDPALVAAHV